jgi:hypothetical protein
MTPGRKLSASYDRKSRRNLKQTPNVQRATPNSERQAASYEAIRSL